MFPKLAVSISMLVFPFAAIPQNGLGEDNNLVPNGSFEEIEGRSKRTGNIDQATGWRSPTSASADVFSETAQGTPVSAPRTQYGDQSALSGTNFAGLRAWSYGGKEPRTYLQTKLSSSLKKGERYCVKFHVSLADLSKYAVSEIGVFLSKSQVTKKDDASLTYNAQVPSVRSKIREDMDGWEGICGIYTAQGDEQYIIIGNFVANEKTDNVKVKRPKGEVRPQIMEAYYFVDDVSVVPIERSSECTCEEEDKAESEHIFNSRGGIAPDLRPAAKADLMVFYFKRYQRVMDRSMDAWVDELAGHMKADPAFRIKLTGHIDAIEQERVRMRPDLRELGRERAEALKDALKEAGIDPARIITAGVGGDEPADTGDSEVAMSKNRRVEVELVR